MLSQIYCTMSDIEKSCKTDRAGIRYKVVESEDVPFTLDKYKRVRMVLHDEVIAEQNSECSEGDSMRMPVHNRVFTALGQR